MSQQTHQAHLDHEVVLAVFGERFDRSERDHKEWRDELKLRLDRMDDRHNDAEKWRDEMKGIFSKWHGGVMVLVGLGAIVTYASGMVEHLTKLFNR